MIDECIRTGDSKMVCTSSTSTRKDIALSKSPLLFKFVSKSFMSHDADIGFSERVPTVDVLAAIQDVGGDVWHYCITTGSFS